MNINLIKQHKIFGGQTCYFEHESLITKTKMKFSTFFPDAVENLTSCIIWLSGLTCTEENFITKANAQKYLANTHTMLICPDTSPRGLNLPKEHESYDFGAGAGFYVNATTEGYSENYRMYDYICKELLEIISREFKINEFSIMGHSMGGHGALVLGLREKNCFKSVSAFAPIVNPSKCPWGKKAFLGYLGEDKEQWNLYDATELLRNGYRREDTIFIDQGLADEFFENQLLTKNFENAAKDTQQKLLIKYREGYDHSYFYITTFIEEHINFHLKSF